MPLPSVALQFTFACILARVAGLVAMAPLFGSRHFPWHFRALLAVALSGAIAPLIWSSHAEMPANWIALALALVGELLIGLILGFGVAILLAGAQVAGQVVSQMSGLSVADVFDPSGEAAEPLLSKLLYMVALAMFVIIGGHRLLIAALLDTYTSIPPGSASLPGSLAGLTAALLGESFSLAVRGAAPAMIALLMATVVLGLVSRAMPQLNILAIGFGLNTMVAVGVLSLSVGALALLLQEQLEPALEMIVTALGSSTG